MKKFHFRLESYLKIKKLKEQEKLGALAKVMAKVNKYHADEAAYEEEYAKLLQTQRGIFTEKAVAIHEVHSLYEFIDALRRRRDIATHNIALLQDELSEKRTAYNEARKARRTIEIIREKKWSEYKMELEKEEIAAMDDFNGQRKNTELTRQATQVPKMESH